MNKQELIENNTGLIYHTLKKLNKFNDMNDREYYYEVGVLGLVKAANTFDPDKRLLI